MPLGPTLSFGQALPAHSIPSPEQLPKRLVISRWQIQSWPERSKSSIICSQRGGLWKIPQLGFSRLAEWWVDCRSPRSVTACIQTEYATDTGNPLVCEGSFLHSFLGLCAHGGSRASSRETPGNTHVAHKGSPTVDLEIRDSAVSYTHLTLPTIYSV